ncbi:MAG: RcpC/CpaB family pilus assembly protein [Elusimicrobiota bacterium]|nr:RcpC/CpaB family pilus assembly protein [Elusimicrobiota bacterium]
MRTLLFAVLVALTSSPAWSNPAEAAPLPAEKRPAWYKLFPRSFARELIKDGTRAVAIQVDDYHLGPVRTGDAVDVLAVFDATKQRGAKERVGATLIQNLRVIGVERGTAKMKGTLRLRANPNEAQYLALAAVQAEISIALRKENDPDIYPMEMATFVKLFR